MKTINAEKPELLRDKAVCQLLSISRSYLWLLVKRGKFPAPIKLAPKMVRWKRSDIQPVLDNPENYLG